MIVNEKRVMRYYFDENEKSRCICMNLYNAYETTKKYEMEYNTKNG